MNPPPWITAASTTSTQPIWLDWQRAITRKEIEEKTSILCSINRTQKVYGIFTTSKNISAVFLTVILNFKCVKMTMNYDYDSVVSVILPVENKILSITPYIKIDKSTPTFYTFCHNTAVVFLLVVKMEAPHYNN